MSWEKPPQTGASTVLTCSAAVYAFLNVSLYLLRSIHANSAWRKKHHYIPIKKKQVDNLHGHLFKISQSTIHPTHPVTFFQKKQDLRKQKKTISQESFIKATSNNPKNSGA